MAMAILTWLVAIPVLGAMTGLRSMTPIALVCLFAYRGTLGLDGTWAFWAAKPVSVIVFAVLAVGELIGDKLPMTPNRTAIFPVVGRVCFGGLVGTIAATGVNGSMIEGGFLGAVSALVWTFLGFHIRHHLVTRLGWKDLWVALGEDAIAIGLSVLALGVITG